MVGRLRQCGLRGHQRGLRLVGGQVVVDQRQLPRRVARAGLDRFFEQRGHRLAAGPAAARQAGQRLTCSPVFGVELDQRLEAGLGRVGLARGDIQAGQRGHRRKVAAVPRHRLLEGLARSGQVAPGQLHLAAQVGRHRLPRLLEFQRVDRRQRRTVGLALQVRGHQRQVGRGAVVGGGHGLQVGQRLLALATGQLGQGCRGADLGVVGLQLGGPVEQRGRGRGLVRQQLGLRGQRQRLGIARVAAGQRFERGQRTGRLAQRQVALRQQPARGHRPGRDLQGLAQQHLGLAGRLQLQFDHGRRLQQQQVVGGAAQQPLKQLACARQIALQQRQLAFEQPRQRMLGQQIVQSIELRLRRRTVAPRQVQRDQRAMRRGMVGAHRQCLAVGSHHRGRLGLLAGQQVALEQPAVGALRVDLQQGFESGPRAGQITGHCGGSGLQTQRGLVVGHGAQGQGDAGTRSGEVAFGGLGLGYHGL